MNYLKEEEQDVLVAEVIDILKDFEASRKAPVHQDETKTKLKEALTTNKMDLNYWNGAEQWVNDFEEVLDRLGERAPTLVKSVDQAESFLNAFPQDHPLLSQLLLDRISKVFLSHDPVVPVVALLLQQGSGEGQHCLVHYAAKGGASLEVIQYLTKKFPRSLNKKDEGGCLPLHRFLQHHKFLKDENGLENVLIMVEHFADAAPASLSTPLKDGQYALHLCFDLIEHMNYSPSAFPLAACLMERYPQALNVQGPFCNYTPLQHALYRGAPLGLLQRMVELAPVSSRTMCTRTGELALHTACEYGRFELARMLLTKDALHVRSERDTQWCPLELSKGIVSEEKDDGPPNTGHLKSFINDCRDLLGPKDFQQWLYVQLRHEVKEGGFLEGLLGQCPPDVLSSVLTHRDETGFLLMELELGKCEAAVNTGHLKLLIEHAPECLESTGPSLGQTPLHMAVTHDNQQAVHVIITAVGSDKAKALLQRDKYGRLPLHVAVMAGASLGLLKMLIDYYPATLWTPDNNGYTPLHYAFHVDPEKVGWWAPSCSCKRSRLSHAGINYLLGVVKLLVRYHHGEDARRALWMADRSGRLPLHHAVAEDGRVVDLLLNEMGPEACKSAVDSAGRLVLHVALECQVSQKTMEVVLDQHNLAQLGQPDGRGRLPLLVACESGCSIDVVYLLVRRAPAVVQHLL